MATAGEDNPGYEIPDYRLVRRIGEGSFGEVWLARNVLGGHRAVKIVHRRTSGAHFDREFDGIRLFADVCLGNPGQLAVLHVGRRDEEGFFYYVMELADDAVRGRDMNEDEYLPLTLDEERRRRQHTVVETIRIGVALGQSLAFLHGKGLVHRDVKPSNVVVVSGVYKLADVGLMEASATDSTPIGTKGYVPEEEAGTPAVDIYALGKVLYEVVNRRDRMDFPTLTPLPPKSTELAAFSGLNRIILRACDPDPKARYPSMQEMVDDLQLLLIPRVQRTIRYLQNATFIGFFLVAVMAALALVGYWQASRFAEEAYGAQLNQANLALSVTNFARARALLDTQTNRLIDPRGFEWYALRKEAEGDPCVPLQREGPEVTALRFHPDGRRLLGYAPLGGTEALHEVIEWDLSTPGNNVRTQSTNVPIGLDLAGNLWTLPPRVNQVVGPGGVRVPIPEGPDIFRTALTLEPFRDLARPGAMAARFPGTDLWIWTAQCDPAPRIRPSSVPIPGGSDDETAFSVAIGDGPDPRVLAATISGRNHNARMALVSFRISGASAWRTEYSKAITALRMDATGRRIAAANQGSHDLEIRDAETGAMLWSNGLHFGALTTIAFSSDGSLVATGGEDAVVVVSRVEDGAIVRRFVGLGGKVRALAWDVDGHRLAASSAGGDVRMWSLHEPPRSSELSGFQVQDGGGLAFSGDGEWLAVSNPDDSVALISMKNPGHRERLAGVFRPLHFDSDQTLLGYNRAGYAVRASRFPPFEVQQGVALVPRTNRILEISAAVATGPLKRWILVAGTDGSERLWDGYAGRLVWSDHLAPPTNRASNPGMTYAARDTDRAIISHRWGQVRVLDTSANPAGSRVLFETSTFTQLQAAYLSPDGLWYAVASEDGRTGVARVGDPIGRQVVTSSAELFSVGFVRKGNRLIGGTGNGELQVYSMNPLRPLTLMSAVDSRVRRGAYFVRDMALSPDERWLAARTMAGTVRLWEVR
jgi:WD40 repeat protein